MRIACIHAHPDDAEILAGGTLTILAGLGHAITIVTLSAGDCGSREHAPAELAIIRQLEARAAAAVIRAQYRWGGFQDLAIFNDDASRREVTGLLRDIRPELVLTAAPSDYHCDHEATSMLVRDACFAASVPNYETPGDGPALPSIPHLYFMDPVAQMDRAGAIVKPDFTVDVGSVFATKIQMLAKHESQRAWLSEQHGMDDYLRQTEEWTRLAGARAGLLYGEGFRQYCVQPHPAGPVLQDLLRDYAVYL